MATVAGLRRAVTGEGQKADDGIPGLASPENGGRRPSMQPQHGIKSRSVLSGRCLVVFVTVIALALLVIRIGVSVVIVVGPAVSNAEHDSELGMFVSDSAVASLQKRSSDLPQLTTTEDTYGATRAVRARHDARILARKSEKARDSSRDCPADEGMDSALGPVAEAYHSPKLFYQDFREMACKFKIFVYPHSPLDPYLNILEPYPQSLTGNYASEHYFKVALMNSGLITSDPSEADLFYLPFSVAMMRNDKRIGVEGIKVFVKEYVANISEKYPYWNRSGGADHFYVNCHSIGKTATDQALHVRNNAIQVVCSSSYHIQVYFPHKDATIPQVWPREDFPKQAASVEQRKTLAFFAGAGNSPVRKEVAKHWLNDSEVKVYTQRISTPYDKALLTSKYCLHVKGFEVNTARLADALHYGCVPVIIANYHDLPYNDVLDWSRFSLVVTTEDIPRLKEIIKDISHDEYLRMHKNVMQVRQHFEWHITPEPFDAFYMVMYELWLRRHVVRFSLT